MKLGNLDVVHDLSDQLLCANVLSFCLKGEPDTVPQHIQRNGSYILWCYVAALIQKRMCFGSDAESDTCSGRSAEIDELCQVAEAIITRVPSGMHQIHNVPFDFLIEVNFPDQLQIF